MRKPMKAKPGAKTGLQAAVALVIGGQPLPQGPRQLPLIPSGAVDEGAPEPGEPEKRGPGRPPGALNKSTEQMTAFLLRQYRSPLAVLAEIYSRSVVTLAQELNCDLLEAFKLQLVAAKELAPYVHAKQPVAVQVDGNGIVNLILADPSQMAAARQAHDGIVIQGEILPTIIHQQNEENQCLTDGQTAELDAPELDTSPKDEQPQ